jgi:hypothetical protein
MCVRDPDLNDGIFYRKSHDASKNNWNFHCFLQTFSLKQFQWSQDNAFWSLRWRDIMAISGWNPRIHAIKFYDFDDFMKVLYLLMR